MPEFSQPCERAIFYVRQQLRLQPSSLWLSYFLRKRRRARDELFGPLFYLFYRLVGEAMFDLASVIQCFSLLAAEVNAVKLVVFVRDAGNYERVAFTARSLTPCGLSAGGVCAVAQF